ncbi:DUF5136 domain-containing protein [Streptomyces scabiei]|nr:MULTISPECIES: DUF5136 domain-containing protein [Streptomyces]MBP5891434.1 D-alanyl-D-alanine carboxypeptidase [Streptomyces sp. LBUM 1481]MBP5914645.1 D-alanyl-D-alanine carboxypeptidase [Streptomyces sp. LBUM 1486]MBP5921587.1 D-alanyl-D-alanine carboxypeptidase [Streptomyces sp. LBUM 1483]MDX2690994.1 DUF5136 domain-containing protein [Streptomyces scabiei]MDX2755395.1 DUF5136 domain-containing protein [Streptomyces scabiei]
MTQLHTPKASRNQERGRLSFMRSVSPPTAGSSRRGASRGASRRERATARCGGIYRSEPCTFSIVPASQKTARRPLLVTSATLLSLSLSSLTLTAAPAFAAKPSPSSSASPSATPPATMSTVGGEQLGRPGTRAALGSDAPVLPKGISARSWIVADAESGDVLAAHNAHWRLAPASTLKMLFADTLLPKFNKDDEHKVLPADLAGIGAGSSMVGIKEDEKYTVHDLWLGVFLRSGNDAVHVLSAMNGGVKQTVADMNEHAEELQALDTHAVSPDGYDAKGQVSSAYDLTLFARSGLQKKDFREYCSTVRAKFPGETKKGKNGKKNRSSFEIQNTNRLLTGDSGLDSYQGIAGVKNGNTTNAGATFTGVAERDGRVLLVTVMHPEKNEHNQVYKETASLLDWGFKASGKVTPVGELVPPKSTETSGGSAEPTAGPGTTAPTSASGGAGGKSVAASASGGGGGIGVALGITGGVLVLVAGAVFLVNRKWPLRGRK